MKYIGERLKILWHWAGANRKHIYGAVFFAALSGLAMMVPYMGIYALMEGIYEGTLTAQGLMGLCLLVGVSLLVRYGSFTLSEILSHKGAYASLFEIRQKMIEHMAQVPLGALGEKNRGEIKKILNEDIEKLELFLAHHLPEVVMYLIGPLAIFIYLLKVNPLLAWVTLLPLPVAFHFQKKMFQNVHGLMQAMGAAMANLNASMIEYITGMRLIKSYNMTSTSFTKYRAACEEKSRLWKEISRIKAPNFASFSIVIEFGLLLMIPAAGQFFIRGRLSAIDFILFLFVGSLYLVEIKPLLEIGGHFSQVLASVDKIQEILALPVYAPGEKTFPKETSIEFKKVTFAYDGVNPTIKDFDLKIPEGHKVAIVGPSGAGKSTLLGLIARFYDVDQGAVLIGGKDVRSIDYPLLLQHIGIVFQKNFLTKGSILDNLTMGKDYRMEEVREACQKAQIDDVIMALPQGYQTLMGGHESRFSGGEKQRLSLARAFLKNAPILILDEATSNTDPENQVKINQALKALFVGKTVIIVAHRLSTVQDCDQIIVLEDGVKTGENTHEALLLENAYYQNVWDKYRRSRTFVYHQEVNHVG